MVIDIEFRVITNYSPKYLQTEFYWPLQRANDKKKKLLNLKNVLQIESGISSSSS